MYQNEEIIINLTPHPVRIGNIEYSPSGTVARVEEEYFMSTGIKVIDLGSVKNLPPKMGGKKYIVSAMVAIAKQDRDDLVIPVMAVRDTETRRVIGNQALARLVIKGK